MAIFKYGSKGDEVKKLQQQLTDAGYDTKGIDGIFGANTQAAVRAYQKANNLDVDGIAGSQTLGSLYKPSTKMSASALPADYTSSIGTNKDWYNPDSGMSRQQYESGLSSGSIKVPTLTTQTATPAQTTPTTPDLSGLSNINFNPTVTIPEYKSPYEEKINALLDKYLNYDPNAAFDVTADPQYAPLKQQYDAAGQSAFNNQIGRLSALTGGRPSTAAVGTATAAQNQYAKDFAGTVIPSLVNAEMTRRQNAYGNIAEQLKMLQGLEADSYGAYRDTLTDTRTEQDRARQNFIDTIGQYYDDYQAQYNKVRDDGDPSNDWQLPLIASARQEKIANTQAAEAKAEQTAYDREVEQAKLQNDTRLTNAQISNYAADNARLANESGNKTTDVTKMGTPEQLNQYYDLLNIYSGNGPTKLYANNAYGAYQDLVANKQTYVGALGQKLYDQITADVQNMMKNEKTYSGESAGVSAYNNILAKALSAKNNQNAAGSAVLDAANIIINSKLSDDEQENEALQLQMLDQLGIDLESLQ